MNTEIQQLKVWRQNSLFLLLRLLRPKQWSKNVFVFSALLFSLKLLEPQDFYRTLFGFITFCLISSCVYIINDYADREADRNHPVKRNRPLASGQLSPSLALTMGSVLLIVTLLGAFRLDSGFGILIISYFLINVLYSFRLKHIVILDIMTIALGFVLRAIGGGLIIHVPITPWFLLCIMLLALFLAIGKRRHEIVLLEEYNIGNHRKVLAFYSLPLLDQMNGMVTSAIILCYALFTFTSGQSIYLMWTIPFVLYGMFRYLYLIHIEKKGGSPDKLLFEDKHILFTVLGYIITAVVVMYIL